MLNDAFYEGYWQNEKYWEDIKDIIVEDFEFKKIENRKLKQIEDICKNENSVSVHIRRGDYLKPEFFKLYGNICTEDYYKRAINYMKENNPDAKFILFSNNIDWLRKEYSNYSFIIASDYIDEKFPNWYEMYLMSICKHNIIANSTFSWWGAYLNKNHNKIVVGPKTWLNGLKSNDILPKGWVKI